MYKNRFVHHLTKVFVDIMFYGGIICCAALPFAMPKLAFFLGYDKALVLPFTIILFSSGLCALFILWQLKAIFKALLGGDPFISANVSCLKKCSAASFVIAIIYIIKMIFSPTLMTIIIAAMFALLGLFTLTIKDVFAQAVAYKEENDWTV